MEHADALGRVVVVDETRRSGGVGEAVVSGLVEAGYTGRISRVAAHDTVRPARRRRQPRAGGCRRHHRDIAVLVRDLASVGGLIDAVAQAGGPNLTMHGVSFSLLDPAPQRSEARLLAVQSARSVATELAAAAGVAIGDVISIVEGGVASAPVGRAMIAARFESSTPVEAGSHEVAADVTITYRLIDAG
jgi:uncharacterized protein